MLEIAFSTVDCTNVIVSADGMIFEMPSSWFFEYQIDSIGKLKLKLKLVAGGSAKRGLPRRATVSLGIDMHLWVEVVIDLIGEYSRILSRFYVF